MLSALTADKGLDLSVTQIATNVLKAMVGKVICCETITYSEVQDDCSINRRQLVVEDLPTDWQSCLRSGEVLVSLMHASEKIKCSLAEQGCPLLPLQEGAEHMDWLRLRSRFLGNWRNILNVLRVMQKKCPELRLETLQPNTGEIIVDSIDLHKSRILSLASLTQCMVLQHAERFTQEDMKELQQAMANGVDLGFPAYYLQQHLGRYQSLDANNSADHQLAQQQQCHKKQTKTQHVNQDEQQSLHQQHPQPKLDRLNGTKRVICVYDTTTAEDEETNSEASSKAPGDVGDGRPGIALSATALDKILQHMDEIKALLKEAASPPIKARGDDDRLPVNNSHHQQQQQKLKYSSVQSLPPTVLSLLQLHRLHLIHQQEQKQQEEQQLKSQQQQQHQKQHQQQQTQQQQFQRNSEPKPHDLRAVRQPRQHHGAAQLQASVSDAEHDSGTPVNDGDNQLSDEATVTKAAFIGNRDRGVSSAAHNLQLGQANASGKGRSRPSTTAAAAATAATTASTVVVKPTALRKPVNRNRCRHQPKQHSKSRHHEDAPDTDNSDRSDQQVGGYDDDSDDDDGGGAGRGKITAAVASFRRIGRRRSSLTPTRVVEPAAMAAGATAAAAASAAAAAAAAATAAAPAVGRSRRLPSGKKSPPTTTAAGATALTITPAPVTVVNVDTSNGGRRPTKPAAAQRPVASVTAVDIDDEVNMAITRSTIQDLIQRMQSVLRGD